MNLKNKIKDSEIYKRLSKSPKLVAAGVAGIVFVFIIVVLVAPMFVAIPFSNNQIADALENESFINQINPFSPQVVVFSTEQDGDVAANFVSLQKSWLIGWEVTDISRKETRAQTANAGTQDLVNQLSADIAEGRLTAGPDIDIDEITEQDQQILEQDQAEYDVIAEVADGDGDSVLKLRSSASGPYLELNGKKLEITGRLAGPAISYEGETICYTKYDREGDGSDQHSHFSGDAYCYDVASATENLVYSFGENISMSLGVNKDYLVYSLDSGEIGIVSLSDTDKEVILSLDIIPTSDPSSIIYVDETSAIISPNDQLALQSTDSDEVININLSNMSWERY